MDYTWLGNAVASSHGNRLVIPYFIGRHFTTCRLEVYGPDGNLLFSKDLDVGYGELIISRSHLVVASFALIIDAEIFDAKYFKSF